MEGGAIIHKLTILILVVGILGFLSSFIIASVIEDETYIKSLAPLLSGSSFLIVLAGILLQKDELKLQREELRLQREELKNQGHQLKTQADEMKNSRKIHEDEIYIIKRHQFETTLLSLVDRKNEEQRSLYTPQSSGFDDIKGFLKEIDILDDAKRRNSIKRIKPYMHSVINIYGYIKEMNISDRDKEQLFKMLRYQFHSDEKSAIKKYIVNEENEEDKKILNYAIENLIVD